MLCCGPSALGGVAPHNTICPLLVVPNESSPLLVVLAKAAFGSHAPPAALWCICRPTRRPMPVWVPPIETNWWGTAQAGRAKGGGGRARGWGSAGATPYWGLPPTGPTQLVWHVCSNFGDRRAPTRSGGGGAPLGLGSAARVGAHSRHHPVARCNRCSNARHQSGGATNTHLARWPR